SAVTGAGGVAGQAEAIQGQSPAETAQGQNPAEASAGTEAPAERRLKITLRGVAAKDQAALIEEFGNLGRVISQVEQADGTAVWVETTCSPDDIEAVACFIIDA